MRLSADALCPAKAGGHPERPCAAARTMASSASTKGEQLVSNAFGGARPARGMAWAHRPSGSRPVAHVVANVAGQQARDFGGPWVSRRRTVPVGAKYPFMHVGMRRDVHQPTDPFLRSRVALRDHQSTQRIEHAGTAPDAGIGQPPAAQSRVEQHRHGLLWIAARAGHGPQSAPCNTFPAGIGVGNSGRMRVRIDRMPGRSGRASNRLCRERPVARAGTPCWGAAPARYSAQARGPPRRASQPASQPVSISARPTIDSAWMACSISPVCPAPTWSCRSGASGSSQHAMSPGMNLSRVAMRACVCGGWIDHVHDTRHAVGGKAAASDRLTDEFVVGSVVHATGLVAGGIAVNPSGAGAEFLKGTTRLQRNGPHIDSAGGADGRNGG